MRIETTIYIERDGEELELTVQGTFYRAERDTGIGAGCELESVLLDGKPWSGELTAGEEDTATEALDEAAADADDYDYEPDYEPEDRFDYAEEGY